MSIAHNKSLNPLLNLHINCISARSAPQILSIKGDCTFLLLNFIILVGLCNPSANSRVLSEALRSATLARQAKFKGRLFEIFSFLVTLPEVILSKIYRPLK